MSQPGHRLARLTLALTLAIASTLLGGAAGAAIGTPTATPAATSIGTSVGTAVDQQKVRTDLSTGAVTVSITRIAPADLEQTSTLVVNGDITNTTAHPLAGMTVSLGSEGVIGSRARLDALRLTPEAAAAFTPAKPLRTLKAGVAETFSLLVPNAGSLLTPDRVTLLAVLINGTDGVLGRAELPMPYFPVHLSAPLHVAIVLPVSAAPDQGPVAATGPGTSQVPTASLIADLSPRGRLDTVVKAAMSAAAQGGIRATQLTLAVDPALLVRVCAIADKCAIAETSPGATSLDRQIAANWLSELQTAAAIPSITLVGLPYADADVAAMADDGAGDRAAQLLATANRQVHGILTQASASNFAPLLPVGELTPKLADAARTVGLGTAVVNDDQAPAPVQPDSSPPTETATARLRIGAGAISALVTDPGLEQLFAPAPDAFDVQHVQDLLAELGVITSEKPSNPTVRTVVLEAPRIWNVSPGFATRVIDQLASVPYVATVSLAAAAAEPPGARATPRPSRTGLLPATSVARVESLRAGVDELKELATTPQTERLSIPLADQLERALSLYWRGSGPAAATGSSLLNQVAAQLPVNSGVIKLSANADGVLLTGASGILPVAINNGLPETVTLGVDVVSDPPGQVTGIPERVELPAGRASTQIDIHISARSTRQTTVTISVRPWSAPNAQPLAQRSVKVRSTAVGVVAVGITAGALTVLVLAILIRLGRKLYRRRHAATQA